MDRDAILRRAHEAIARADETLATPRAEGRPWQLPERKAQPNATRRMASWAALEGLANEIAKTLETERRKQHRHLEARLHTIKQELREEVAQALVKSSEETLVHARREIATIRSENDGDFKGQIANLIALKAARQDLEARVETKLLDQQREIMDLRQRLDELRGFNSSQVNSHGLGAN